MWLCNWHGKNLCISIQKKVFKLLWPKWSLFNKAHFLSMDNKLSNTQILMLHQCPVPVTLDEKQQYLIVHAVLMALKLMVQEELVNLIRNSKNVNVKWYRYRLCVAQKLSKGINLLFHDQALEGGGWSPAHPGRTLPQERPGTHFKGLWVGSRAGLDRQKIWSPLGFNPRPSSP